MKLNIFPYGNTKNNCGEILLIGLIWLILRKSSEGLVMKIADLLKSTNLDFADCYLLVRARREKLSLKTFDKSLEKQFLIV